MIIDNDNDGYVPGMNVYKAGGYTCNHCGATEVPTITMLDKELDSDSARWFCAACLRSALELLHPGSADLQDDQYVRAMVAGQRMRVKHSLELIRNGLEAAEIGLDKGMGGFDLEAAQNIAYMAVRLVSEAAQLFRLERLERKVPM